MAYTCRVLSYMCSSICVTTDTFNTRKYDDYVCTWKHTHNDMVVFLQEQRKAGQPAPKNTGVLPQNGWV